MSFNWIVCPCRNGLNLTRKAVESFRAQDIGDVRILLILNNPTDGTAEWANAQYGLVKMHCNPPLSVAASWNRGLDWLFSKNAPYVLVVNNDVELLPETYRLLVEDGGKFVTGVGENKPSSQIADAKAGKRPHPDFSCFLIRQETWIKVGKFNENYKIAYCEDLDYHLRMHKAGIEAYCIGVPFLHHLSSTIKNFSAQEQEEAHKQHERNRKFFEKEWGFAVGSQEYYDFFKEKP